jgi:hypothetical protein
MMNKIRKKIADRMIEKNISIDLLREKIWKGDFDLDSPFSTVILERICNILELDFSSALNGCPVELNPAQYLRLNIEKATSLPVDMCSESIVDIAESIDRLSHKVNGGLIVIRIKGRD